MPFIDELLEWLDPVDFAVLEHGWATHGRDYIMIVQDMIGSDPGTHELTFTHCVRLDYETRVPDETWAISWTDDLLDYPAWLGAGEPAGLVWGTNWSNAYPGLRAIAGSGIAGEWSKRLSKPMTEVRLETERFELRLVFHSVRWRKISDDIGLISGSTFASRRGRGRTDSRNPTWSS